MTNKEVESYTERERESWGLWFDHNVERVLFCGMCEIK